MAKKEILGQLNNKFFELAGQVIETDKHVR